jgi:hypothetical protein
MHLSRLWEEAVYQSKWHSTVCLIQILKSKLLQLQLVKSHHYVLQHPVVYDTDI